jgi:hypothetical protein
MDIVLYGARYRMPVRNPNFSPFDVFASLEIDNKLSDLKPVKMLSSVYCALVFEHDIIIILGLIIG